ncbi:hypothetical protein BG261_00030 [Floricoccus tropicus]|uniref:Nudix hydrolase domain-containing protein n=1 Tax=Floricoccus tropicus TaxID=1859473 RepID=A0A1E8GPZ4_9LACT|nr:8-oxo-dGTP diphosphatase [Floricoccus tropicus]OFI50312.1 hypothetical protein BG261_00030 [Floricoccus tropicus]
MSRAQLVSFTNMCMIYDDQGKVLVQKRTKKDWPGLTLPGGHVEENETFYDAVIREVYEETGLTIENPELCGTMQYLPGDGVSQISFLYKTKDFSGQLMSSEEGRVFWIDKTEIFEHPCSSGLKEIMEVINNDQITEFYYKKVGDDWIMDLY